MFQDHEDPEQILKEAPWAAELLSVINDNLTDNIEGDKYRIEKLPYKLNYNK